MANAVASGVIFAAVIVVVGAIACPRVALTIVACMYLRLLVLGRT